LGGESIKTKRVVVVGGVIQVAFLRVVPINHFTFHFCLRVLKRTGLISASTTSLRLGSSYLKATKEGLP
jgi:hypothetical protein